MTAKPMNELEKTLDKNTHWIGRYIDSRRLSKSS